MVPRAFRPWVRRMTQTHDPRVSFLQRDEIADSPTHLSRAFLARGQTDLEFSPLRPRARSSAMRSRLAFDSLWSRAANRADRLGTLSGRERPRIGTSSARVASVWCFTR